MTDIVRRAGTILGRIVRIPEAKPEVALERRVTEERARVVNRVGPGVRAEDQQTGLANLLRTDVEGESMIPREALIAAAVHTGQARPVDAVGPKARTTTAAGAGADREQEQATAALIQVVQRVEEQPESARQLLALALGRLRPLQRWWSWPWVLPHQQVGLDRYEPPRQ